MAKSATANQSYNVPNLFAPEYGGTVMARQQKAPAGFEHMVATMRRSHLVYLRSKALDEQTDALIRISRQAIDRSRAQLERYNRTEPEGNPVGRKTVV
jgi:hypothetical protein